jgi:hypothetical protein
MEQTGHNHSLLGIRIEETKENKSQHRHFSIHQSSPVP